MSTPHTVHFDAEAEASLEEILRLTGLTVAEALKQGLLAYREKLGQPQARTAYDIYSELDLGEGGYAVAPSTETRRGVREALLTFELMG